MSGPQVLLFLWGFLVFCSHARDDIALDELRGKKPIPTVNFLAIGILWLPLLFALYWGDFFK